jgi:hypothetical protein
LVRVAARPGEVHAFPPQTGLRIPDVHR